MLNFFSCDIGTVIFFNSCSITISIILFYSRWLPSSFLARSRIIYLINFIYCIFNSMHVVFCGLFVIFFFVLFSLNYTGIGQKNLIYYIIIQLPGMKSDVKQNKKQLWKQSVMKKRKHFLVLCKYYPVI